MSRAFIVCQCPVYDWMDANGEKVESEVRETWFDVNRIAAFERHENGNAALTLDGSTMILTKMPFGEFLEKLKNLVSRYGHNITFQMPRSVITQNYPENTHLSGKNDNFELKTPKTEPIIPD